MNTRASDQEIADFVRAYVALSKGKRFAEKRALWDADEPFPLLHPEEASVALVGWPALNAYWSHSNAVMRDLETQCWDIGVTWLGPGNAIATYLQRWRATLENASSLLSGPIASTVRVVLGVRNRGPGWRVFCCVESHVDGVEYFRLLLQTRRAD